jgi:hypothetical protein
LQGQAPIAADVYNQCQVVDIMCQHGLATKHPSGAVALTSNAVIAVQEVRSPVPILDMKRESGKPFTTYELRRELCNNGWSFGLSAWECSVHERRMMNHNHQTYYVLLFEHFQRVVTLAAQNWFSHSQKHGYYKVLKIMCETNPFERYLAA